MPERQQPTTPCRTSGAMSGRPPSNGSRASTSGGAGRRTDRSEPQAAQLPRVSLPVLGDLDVQVEVDRRTEQCLDLLTGAASDLAQPRTAVADHDALLRGPLDEEVGVDVEQRLVV